MAVAHYLDALAWQRQVAQTAYDLRRQESAPEPRGGGCASAISVHSGEGTGSTAVMRSDCNRWRRFIDQMRSFVDEVYLPDTLAIASFYKDWFKTGEGVGNFMTYGDFPETGSQDPKTFLVPRGAILGRDLSHIQEVDLNAEEDIQEFVPTPGMTTAAARRPACILIAARRS